MTISYDFSIEGSTADFTILSQGAYKMEYMNDGWYHEMLAVEAQSPGIITLTWYEMNSLREETAIAFQYTFTVDEQLQVTQTDLSAFVPDGYNEAEVFTTEHGSVSIWDGYIVFCDECYMDGGYSYTMQSVMASTEYEVVLEENIVHQSYDLVDGSSAYYVQVLKPASTGYIQAIWQHKRDWENTPTETTQRIFRVSPMASDITDVTEELGEFLLGDGNGDGQVTIADAVVLQKWLLGCDTLSQWMPFDLNADMALNGFDLGRLRGVLTASMPVEEA